MAYSRSKIYKQYCMQIDEIIDVLRKLKLKNNESLDISIKNYAIASCIFLAHAELENYIQDIFDTFISSLNDKKFKELNTDLQAFLIYRIFIVNEMHISVISKEESKSIKKIKRELNDSSKHFFDKDINLSGLKGIFIYESFKYPSVKNIEKIYKRIGCDNVFDMVSRELKRNAQSILEQLGSYRTSLAHNATLVGVTPNDVIKTLNDIKDFSKGLDKILYKRVVEDHTQKFWNNHLSKI